MKADREVASAAAQMLAPEAESPSPRRSEQERGLLERFFGQSPVKGMSANPCRTVAEFLTRTAGDESEEPPSSFEELPSGVSSSTEEAEVGTDLSGDLSCLRK